MARIGYSTEEDVYSATGFNATVMKNLSGKQLKEITDMVTKWIEEADKDIRRRLGVPITVRKEYHLMEFNDTINLGPHEDLLEFFGNDDPENNVEKIFAIYLGSGGRLKLPYPKDCDSFTENIDDITGTNATVTKEKTIVKAGEASIKIVFTAGGLFYFPTDENLNKNIKPWEYIGFWFYTSDITSTFTMNLYDKDGNSNTQTFTPTLNNTWEIVSLRLDAFTGSIGWETTKLQKIEIVSSKICTCYFDNFNFNNLMFWTTPEGLICWSDPTSQPCLAFEVTYSYDPYKSEVPEDIRKASAKLAGVAMLDYAIGARVRIGGFKQMSQNMSGVPERDQMEVTRGRLMAEAQKALAGIGFKTYEGIGTA